MKKTIRLISLLLVLSLVLPLFAINSSADLEVTDLERQIKQTYLEAKEWAKRDDFCCMCGTFVAWELYILGINKTMSEGNYAGKNQFDHYKDMKTSTGGYSITAYPASKYTLKSALKKITNSGKQNAYDILVGFEKTSGTDAGKKYGHVIFIHGIIDGTVYYSESSYSTATIPKEGKVKTKTISSFASACSSYEFDGVIHFQGTREPYTDYDKNPHIRKAKTPPDMKKGDSFTIKGMVYSRKADLTSVTVAVYNSKGTAVMSKTVKPNRKFYNLNRIYKSFDFSTLATGTYTYVVKASTESSTKELKKTNFNVGKVASGDDTITLTGAEYPEVLSPGDVFSPVGVVKSAKTNLLSVAIAILDEEGTKLSSVSASPTAKTYDLSKMDLTGLFQNLTAGEYYYRVTGKNSAGSVTLAEAPFSVVLPPVDPGEGQENPFVDVKEDKYYYDPVLWAYYHEPDQITKGTDDTHFSPNQTCSRAQVVSFLWNALNKPEPDTSNNPFVDVMESKYYYKAVLWAFQNGVTKGADDTHFNPNGSCTRAQVVSFIWNALGKPEPASTDSPFVDVKPGKYYYNAVLWAVEQGITKGTDDTHFSPNQTCTRAQVVTFLYNALAE